MSGLLIRKAASSDVEKLVELRLLLQQHGEDSNPSVWRITEEGKALVKQKVENALVGINSQVLVAEMNGEVIGFIHGEVSRRTDYLPKSVGAISTIYVVKKLRRKGVGARLVNELFEFFNSERVEHVTLRYIVGNRAAEGFWKKLGFEPIITTAGMRLDELRAPSSVGDLKSVF
jgi:ribosomal protein S18 acetylase RimI-like enzyme